MNGTAIHRTVIVVGSGPTGLLLAGDLATAGVPVTLLEKRSHDISNLSRAFGVHARTLEQLDARGLADQLLATGDTITGLRAFDRLTLDLTTLESRFPFMLITPQYEVERLLERRAGPPRPGAPPGGARRTRPRLRRRQHRPARPDEGPRPDLGHRLQVPRPARRPPPGRHPHP